MATSSTQSASIQTFMSNPLYPNWVKCGLALQYTKKGIEKHVQQTVDQFHQRILNSLPSGQTCSSCTTQRSQSCRKSVCDKIRKKIKNEHIHSSPTWDNTNAKLWCTNSWEIAKCFMPPGGYEKTSSAAYTDLPGLLSVVINYKFFKANVAKIFSDARKTRNSILHNPAMQITDTEMKAYIATLVAVLTAVSDTHAQYAMKALNEIQNGSLTVTNEDEGKVRAESIKALKEKKEEALQQIHALTQDSKSAVIEIAETLHTNMFEDVKETVKNTMAKEREQIVQSLQYGKSYENQKQDLQRDLIRFYRTSCISTPLCPLLPEYDIAIDDIYVEPSMEAVTSNTRESCMSYEDIFVKGSKKIYVVGDAGMGKSSLCQKMVSTWCEAHSSDSIIKNSDNHKCMKSFDFIFLISLRDAIECNCVEEMIRNEIIQYITTSTSKYDHVLSTILDSQRCLVLLDGLDEWKAPTKGTKRSSKSKPGLPIMTGVMNCTVLTMTRPWKLEVLRLKTSEINRQIILLGLNSTASDKLVKTLIQHLNTKNGINMMADDFYKELHDHGLHQFQKVAIVLKQLVCLWHEGKPLGTSKCEIYAKMIEFLFELAIRRIAGDDKYKDVFTGLPTSSKQLPKCFADLKRCQELKSLLCSLATLAFETLFSDCKETSLVFESSRAEIHGLTQEQIRLCLEIGILSQNKVTMSNTSRHMRLSFLHKTVQEFLTALYLTFNEGDTHPIETVKNKCCSLDDIFEIENVLVFASVMQSETACILFEQVQSLSSKNTSTCKYRNSFSFDKIDRVQNLIMECMGEGWKCSHGYQHLYLEDITINKHSDTESCHFDKLFETNVNNMKSIKINKTPTKGCQEHLKNVHSVEKIVISEILEQSRLSESMFNDLLDKSKKTLVTLSLIKIPKMLTTTLGAKLQGFIKLENIYLVGIPMPHDQIVCLMHFISHDNQMRTISLQNITCSECDECDNALDLSQNEVLKYLQLSDCDMSEIQIKPTNLQTCFICNVKTNDTITSLLQSLQQSPMLKVFKLKQFQTLVDTQLLVDTVVKMQTIEVLGLYNIDLKGNELLLSPTMVNLKTVHVFECTMTATAYCRFIDSIATVPSEVHVRVNQLRILPETLGKSAMEYARNKRQNPTLHIIKEDILVDTYFQEFYSKPQCSNTVQVSQ